MENKVELQKITSPEDFVKKLRDIIGELETEKKRIQRENTYNKDFLETIDESMTELDVLAFVYENLIESKNTIHKTK